MQREITAGGRLSITLCIVWAVSLLPPIVGDGRSSKLLEGSYVVMMATSFPLGWMSGAVTTMDSPASDSEMLAFLVLSGVNFFVLGYGLVGIWRLFRHLFGPLAPVEYERDSKAEQVVVGNGEQRR